MNTKVYSQDSVVATFLKRIYSLLVYLREGHFSVILEEIRKRIYSKSTSIGLRRDLHNDFTLPNAAVDIKIRPLKGAKDLTILKDGEIDKKYPKIVKERRELVDSNIPQCYVAETKNGETCYMQWLIGPQHNELIQSFFGNSFPNLNSNEALLEGAFMSYNFRGKGIMPAAMSRITNEARKLGVRWVLTFVDINNIPSLKGCSRSGFSPYIVKNDEWFLFRRKVTFESLNPEVLEEYHQYVDKPKEKQPIQKKNLINEKL